jgi:peptide/nickel transport system substrate-binding protein
LVLLALIGLSCRPQERVVEAPVTQEATREQAVQVPELETVQVVVTSTPIAFGGKETPIPQGGTLVRAIYTDAQTANPITAADPGSRALTHLLFAGLLEVDPFTGATRGHLAESWTVSEDGQTYTFKLRQGLTWSDGYPITAHDFYFSYAALQSGALDTPNQLHAQAIDQIEVPDEHTLRITFAEPNCGNLAHLKLGWLPMHVFVTEGSSSEEATADERLAARMAALQAYDFSRLAVHEFNSSPWVFSGPFVLKEWVRGDHWTVVRNKRYWQGAPHLDAITGRVISGQDELVALLRAGEVDVGEDLKPFYLEELEAEPTLRLYKFMDDGYDFLGFQLGDPQDPQPRLVTGDGGAELNPAHGAHPILADVRVRQAIAHAVDRRALIDKARFGQGLPLYANVLPSVPWAYNTDLEPRAYDLEAAGRLLDQAGWRLDEAGDVRTRDGVPLKLRLYTNAGNRVREAMAGLIRDQLSQVGIEVEIVLLDWYAFLDVLYGQTFDMALLGISDMGTDPDDLHLWRAADDVPSTGGVPLGDDLFGSQSRAGNELLGGRGYNFCSYYNPDLENKLVQARTIPGCDLDQRATLYRQAQAMLLKDAPYLWIDVPRTVVVLGSRLGGANPGPWSLWYNVHEWYLSE